MVLNWTHDASHSRVRPNDRGLRMPFDERSHLLQVGRWFAGLRERSVEVIVDDHQQTALSAEIEDSIESRVVQARDFSRDLRGNKFFMNGELADAGEYSRKDFEYAFNVIDRIHVGRIETRDHGIKVRLLCLRKRLVLHGNPGVREGVVVKGRIGFEIVGGRSIS